MKILYETLNQATYRDRTHLYQCGTREFSRLEPRRSNPLDRYQLPENQWQIPSSKPVSSGNNQHDSNISADDEPGEQYLQVDPRCYVRQNSNNSVITYKKSESPRLEKGLSLNADTRPSPTSSLSPYRQSSFDVTLTYRSYNNNQQQQQQQLSTPSPAISTQQEIFFTPRGSSLSVVGNTPTNTPPGSQHLSPPTPIISRKNSAIEKKDITVELDPSDQTSKIRSSIVQREHEHSRSLEHSSSPSNNSTVDKQSRSFDAVHLLRPVNQSSNTVINRRTKSYECAEEHQLPSPVAPPPIIIKIPNMSELVQAVQLSQLDGYQQDTNRKASQDLWRLRQSYEFEEQHQLDRTSPEDLSPDLLTSTSIDSAGAMAIHHTINKTNIGDIDDDLSKYQYRRKSSSNLLLPPPEVRRQALRRTFEKRRSCINQSNAKREQQLLNNQISLNDENNNNTSSTIKSTDFSSLLNNFNSKSENSSFDRSLETDFDMQSDTSSRGQNDHFTSIESSGNEYTLPDINQRFLHDRQQQQQQSLTQPDDSGYKSLESQNSQNHTFSLDWMSADGGESVIYMGGESRTQQEQTSIDIKDLEEDLNQQQISNNNQRNSNMMQQRSLSTNIPLDDRYRINSINYLLSPNSNLLNNNLVTSSSFNRTASKKRREFSKEKRHATTNVPLPTDEYPLSSTIIHQVNEGNVQKPSSSTLQVRHIDLHRSKSDETEVLESFAKQSIIHSNELNDNIHLSSNSDGLLHYTPLPNLRDSRHIFQRSPSSVTPPVTISPQIAAFRSKRGSISFDHPIPSNNLPILNSTKTSTMNPILPTNITKNRLKFSMVRDTTTSSLGSSTSSHPMQLINDYNIDEKTNRVINEFLTQDNNNTNSSNVISYRESPGRHHHHRIRQKTFDETIMINNNNVQKPSRTAIIKQRQHNSIQTNIRQNTLPYYPSLHLADDVEQDKDKNDLLSSPSILVQQSIGVVRRDNRIAVGSPSIIVTGYDSGS